MSHGFNGPSKDGDLLQNAGSNSKGKCESIFHFTWCYKPSRHTTLKQRRFSVDSTCVKTLNQRLIYVVSTLCACLEDDRIVHGPQREIHCNIVWACVSSEKPDRPATLRVLTKWPTRVDVSSNPNTIHYENTPIQIYWKFYNPKKENFQIKKSDIFHISAQNIDCGYSLEPPLKDCGYSLEPPRRRGGSNEYPQSMFLSRNKKNNVYPCKPQFYYINVGLKWVKII